MDARPETFDWQQSYIFEMNCVASLKSYLNNCLINVRYFILYYLLSANAPFIKPMKISENLRFSYTFRGVEKENSPEMG